MSPAGWGGGRGGGYRGADDFPGDPRARKYGCGYRILRPRANFDRSRSPYSGFEFAGVDLRENNFLHFRAVTNINPSGTAVKTRSSSVMFIVINAYEIVIVPKSK